MRPCIPIFFIVLLTVPLLTHYASTIYAAAESEVTIVSGTIMEDTSWSGNILVTEKLTVAEGVTLRVEPGTIVKFKHWRPGYIDPSRRIQLHIVGTLIAIGSPEKPIRFTSDASPPEHYDWSGIDFDYSSSENNILDYCIVEFAKAGVNVHNCNITLSNSIVRWSQAANVWVQGSSAIINRNRIYGAGHGGIEMMNATPIITYNTIYDNAVGIVPISTSNPILRHNIIVDNRGSGILIAGLSSPLIDYNNITENIDNGIAIATPKTNSTIKNNNICNNGVQLVVEEGNVVATNNWWGTADEGGVESSIQVREGSISYEPYLSSPVDIDEIRYDYENDETYAHPPATENDIFPYFHPSDETRKIVSSWSAAHNPTGIAWDGEYFWVLSLTKKLLKYDPSGKLIDSLTAPGSLPIALTYDGQYLWSLDLSEQLAYQFDFSGRVVKSIPAPTGGYSEGGLAYDGQHLLTLQDRKLYKLDTSGNIVDVVTIHIDWFHTSGLAWDGEHLWAVDKGWEKIFEIDPSNGSVLSWITSPGDETWGMTWAEGYLWACEWTNDWDNYIIVKMEPIAPIAYEECPTVSGDLIVIDGLKGDWQAFHPLVTDPQGDTLEGNVDVKALYGFTDSESMYLMVDFYEVDTYHHIDVPVDVDGDGDIEYLCSIKPCQKDFDFRRGEEVEGGGKFSVLTGIICKEKDVVEIQLPLSLFEYRTELYVGAAFYEEPDGEGHYSDEADWAHVRSIYNLPPTAEFTYSPESPTVGQDIKFTDQSEDPEEEPLSYIWDFNDGSTSTERNPSHRFENAGMFTVKLTVTDGEGAKDTSSITIVVDKLSMTISCSVMPSEVTVGSSITVSGSISPAVSGKTVTISFMKPDGSAFMRSVTTGSDGSYSDSYTPNEIGSWSVKALWEGDSIYTSATSQDESFGVKKSGIGIPGFPYESIILGFVLGGIFLWLLKQRQ